MQITFDIYNDRKKEIEFYLSVIKQIDLDATAISTNDNAMLLRIMKSNLILMLYNITEACISNGLREIFEQLSNDKLHYSQIIVELQHIWTNYEIKKIYGPTSPLKSYQNKATELIETVLNQSSIKFEFTKQLVNMDGNLDSKKIQEICNTYKIRHKARSTPTLEKIKNGRNSLAHGSDSFSQYSQSLSVADLEKYKNDVLMFLQKILEGMKNYYDNKSYSDNNTVTTAAT